VRFVLSRADEEAYDFHFQVRDARTAAQLTSDQGWSDCVYGAVEPDAESLRRGIGNLHVDLSACGQHAQTGERGLASVGFDTRPDPQNPSGKTSVSILFIDFVTRAALELGQAAQPLDGAYEYRESGEGSGQFSLQFQKDLNPNGGGPALDETLRLSLRWNPDGAGRADIEVTGGNLGSLSVQGVECWDNGHLRVYYKDSIGIAPQEGQIALCSL
jgi:hypothetical protein